MGYHFADLAPEHLPDIEYCRITDDQEPFVREAMALPANQARFAVTILPIDTPEQRQAAADEWAAYEQARGNKEVCDQGAVFSFSSRNDKSSAELLRMLENKDPFDVIIPFKPLVITGLLRIVKLDSGAETQELFRKYYQRDDLAEHP